MSEIDLTLHDDKGENDKHREEPKRRKQRTGAENDRHTDRTKEVKTAGQETKKEGDVKQEQTEYGSTKKKRKGENR